VTGYVEVISLWEVHVATPFRRNALGQAHASAWTAPGARPLDVRRAAATAELADLETAASAVDASDDHRAAAAAALLGDAIAAATARVAFLAGLESAYAAALAANDAAIDAVNAARSALDDAAPEGAVAAAEAVVVAEATARGTLRAGVDLVAAWRATEPPVLPDLAAARRRTELVRRAVDAALQGARELTAEDRALELAAEVTAPAFPSSAARAALAALLAARHPA